jgi:hypothetical protein
MKQLISERFAIRSLLFTFSIVIVFHLLVLLQVIPYTIVGGGRIENKTQMFRAEFLALATNMLMLAIVAAKAGFLKWQLSFKAYRIIFWIMTLLFLLNTIGNLFSKSEIEKAIFTPLTLLLALLCFRLAYHQTQKT